MNEKGLGKRLQEARRAAGLTQQTLCQRANLSYSTLAKIERGAIKSPSIFTIQSIAAALNVSLDELVGNPLLPVDGKRVSKSGVRFVYFDLNDCLVRFASEGFIRLAQDSGQSLDTVESLFWQYNNAVCRGDMSLDDLNRAWAERLGVLVDWKRYYLESVEKMPGIDELVGWTAQNYRIGILTNTMPGFVDGLREQNTIPAVAYDAIVDSSVVHHLKPEPEMYQAAAAQAGVSAPEILLVDDDHANLDVAGQQGWHTILFDVYHPEDSIAAIRAALEPGIA
jgi:FMN phosphatase YigB (HAD superfamily)